MIAQAATDNAGTAWITVVGTLGGVVVTAALGLITAFLTQRSQREHVEQEHRLQMHTELRTARRESNVRYIVSAQIVFDRAADLHIQNRRAPVELAEFVLGPPPELADALARNETCRVEVLLLAGDQVCADLKDYDRELKAFWRAVGRGAESDDSETWRSETDAYHRLITAMRAGVLAL